jgi:arylsulfatase A-like enzyme
VVGVDGLRWDRLAVVPAPYLKALAAGGMLAHGAHPRDSPARTDSGPGWSTLATGVGPAKHGVLGNSFAGRRYDRYPDFLTLAGRARPGLSTVAVVDWTALVDFGLFGPEIGARVRFDGETYGYASEDVLVTGVAAELLAVQNPDAAFVYLCSIDEAGHRHGPLTHEYSDAIARVDVMLSRLVGAVRARPTYAQEDWLVLIGTDHGHRDRGGHGRKSDIERAVWVIAHGRAVAPGTRRDEVNLADVAATALYHLGVDVPPDHDLDGRSLLG